ncbi:cytochrome c biogenesis protein ResB [Myxococcota bacterium]|nr:cytochrome c biogenesis protein ResB [Myxococcota bacterium]
MHSAESHRESPAESPAEAPAEASVEVSGAARPSRFAFLWSQGFGLICAFSTVLLLAIGSIVLANTKEGASKGVVLDDFREFFVHPHWAHTWFYLLVIALVFYGLSTFLATWRSLSQKLRSRASLTAYGPVIMHLGFLLALLAHGVSGFFGMELGTITIGEEWRKLPTGELLRLKNVEVESHPNGQPKQFYITLDVVEEEGTKEEVVAFNQPFSRKWGTQVWFLSGFGDAGWRVRFGSGQHECDISEGQECMLGAFRVRLLRFFDPSQFGGRGAAQVEISQKGIKSKLLIGSRALKLEDGTPLELRSSRASRGVVLRGRYVPGDPFALFAVFFFLFGIAIWGRRWV